MKTVRKLIVSVHMVIRFGHNYAHDREARLSWHVLNLNLIRSLFIKFENESDMKFLRDLDYITMSPFTDMDK